MNILLVYPRNPDTFWSFRHVLKFVSRKSAFPPLGPQHWAGRPRVYKALVWIAYGIVRVAMGLMGYGGNEWFRVGFPQRLPRGRPDEES